MPHSAALSTIDRFPPAERRGDRLAFALSGGGASAAYQVGFLLETAMRHPALDVPLLTGVSAGALNAAWIAAARGDFRTRIEALAAIWLALRTEDVMRVDPLALGAGVVRWGLRLLSGGARAAPKVRGLVDTSPLRDRLGEVFGATQDGAFPGIAERVRAGGLDALAITAFSYATGRSVTWVQGAPEIAAELGVGYRAGATIGVDHVMASAALPILFPAVAVDGAWYGDGGLRMTSPLEPALRLGAARILALSTRTDAPYDAPHDAVRDDYPPSAEIAGVLLSSIFHDLLDQDAARVSARNVEAGAAQGGEVRPIALKVVRPSRRLSSLAARHEPAMPRGLRFMTRGLGTREARAGELLGLLMIQPEYIRELIDLGRLDARARATEIDAFLAPAHALDADQRACSEMNSSPCAT
jgi:NTE family protein